MARDLGGLRYELDFPLKFRKSFQRQTVFWVGTALIMGIISAIMPARTKKVRVHAEGRNGKSDEILGTGLALGALKVAATLLRPAVAKFVAKKMGDYAGDGFKRRS